MPARSCPRVLLAEPDPYLAFLIGVDLPEATVEELRDGSGLRDREPDAIVVDLDSPRSADILRARGRVPVIGISSGTAKGAVDVLLHRPFRPAELVRALRAVLGLPGERGRRHSRLDALTRMLGPARVLAIGLGVIGARGADRARARGEGVGGGGPDSVWPCVHALLGPGELPDSITSFLRETARALDAMDAVIVVRDDYDLCRRRT